MTRGPRPTPTWSAVGSHPGSSRGSAVPYPPRPLLRPLPEFAGSAHPRPDLALQRSVEDYIRREYAAGRSLRELAELTDRSHSAIRNILDKHGVRRRGVGAMRSGPPDLSPERQP
ncbi:helix-turn-helix domain-containing protein [Geodermatophilus sp. SYSU D01180]